MENKKIIIFILVVIILLFSYPSYFIFSLKYDDLAFDENRIINGLLKFTHVIIFFLISYLFNFLLKNSIEKVIIENFKKIKIYKSQFETRLMLIAYFISLAFIVYSGIKAEMVLNDRVLKFKKVQNCPIISIEHYTGRDIRNEIYFIINQDNKQYNILTRTRIINKIKSLESVDVEFDSTRPNNFKIVSYKGLQVE